MTSPERLRRAADSPVQARRRPRQSSMRRGRWGLAPLAASLLVSLAWMGCAVDTREFQATPPGSVPDASPSPGEQPSPASSGDGGGRAPASELPPSAPAAAAGECSPDATECLSNVRYRRCSAEGFWSAAEDCESACVGDACGGDCRPGLTRCASESSAETCSDQGEWSAAAACMNACVDGACTGVCVPGATRCFSETELQACNERGQWLERQPCEFACVDGACTGECVPASRRCNPSSGVPQFCSGGGSWQTLEPCPFVCTASNGACGGECAPGGTRCHPTSGVPQRCDGTGTWLDEPACPSYQFCAGAGECRDCNTNAECFSYSCDCVCTAGPAGSPAAICTVEPRNCGIATPPSCTLTPVCVDGVCALR